MSKLMFRILLLLVWPLLGVVLLACCSLVVLAAFLYIPFMPLEKQNGKWTCGSSDPSESSGGGCLSPSGVDQT